MDSEVPDRRTEWAVVIILHHAAFRNGYPPIVGKRLPFLQNPLQGLEYEMRDIGIVTGVVQPGGIHFNA